MEKITQEEKRIVRWFLNKKCEQAKQTEYREDYLYCMGWLYCNSMVLSGINPLHEALRSIDIIKEKDPETFQNYMAICTSAYNNEVKKLKHSDNLVTFPDKKK